MRIISINVNGIRSAHSKGLFNWLKTQQADVVCLQEIRANLEQLDKKSFFLDNYHHYYFSAEKKGYSGVAVYAKAKPLKVHKPFKLVRAQQEGRYLQLDYENISIASLYLPSGSRDEDKQLAKYDFMHHFEKFLRQQKRKPREYIICGDWNIAHKKIDLKNWRSNQKNSGFLPEERAWFDHLIDKLGYIDAMREVEKGPEIYTWWSNRGQSWQNNVGWRLDYQMVSSGLKSCINRAEVYKEQRFSDHAPLIIDYNWQLK